GRQGRHPHPLGVPGQAAAARAQADGAHDGEDPGRQHQQRDGQPGPSEVGERLYDV
ncbi:MAG: hypothetical protein AVDCRST_MAG69-2510, partial [uncultured Solirubrobacteraceae bacterium]